ncbi:EAL domain-containing protein [Aliamphritea hakodatensis]|uniref:EAL domain-containing protein n=1 Tax=Aliamphritea hakodatensis TaxID=2895352 RepID=UPI0022FD79D0|nr:EAL domain-containing protein [Aliamphritea hakodatensis]
MLLSLLSITWVNAAKIDLSAQEQAWLDARQAPVRIGLAVVPPYLTVLADDGGIEGLSVDFLREIETQLETPFNYIKFDSYSAMMSAMRAGEIDVIFGIAKTVEREKYLRFTPSYAYLPNKIFTRKELFDTAEMADFAGMKFSVRADTALAEFIRKNYPRIELVESGDIKESFDLLVTGEVAGVGAYPSGGYQYSLQQGINNLSIVGDVGFDYRVSFATGIDAQMLHQLLSKGLAAIPAATADRFSQEWLKPEDSLRVDIGKVKEGVLWLVLALLVVGLAGLFLWNRSLKKEVKSRQKIEEEVRYLAFHDDLTGVRNRQYFKDMLQDLDAVGEKAPAFALLLFGLDAFRLINDSLGHKVGDYMLKRVAERIQSRLEAGCEVARISGDEFAVFIPGDNNQGSLKNLVEILIAEVSKPMSHGDQSLTITSSVGIASNHEGALDTLAVLEYADLALHRAKEVNPGGYMFYCAEMTAQMNERQALASALREALDNKQLYLEYQPQLVMGSGKICGFEALVRWNHPEKGRIPPNIFVEIAEKEGMMITLGDQVLGMACRQAVQWQRQGVEFERVAVNVSVKQFVEPDFVEKVLSTLEETGLSARSLELEITESLFMGDLSQAKETMLALNEKGVQFAIDDFGTGFSSLLYLKNLPVDKLKLDQGFIREITNDNSSLQIVKASLQMGHALRMSVIAEGVETEEERALLMELNCDQAQGYLYSRPLPEAFILPGLEAEISQNLNAELVS